MLETVAFCVYMPSFTNCADDVGNTRLLRLDASLHSQLVFSHSAHDVGNTRSLRSVTYLPLIFKDLSRSFNLSCLMFIAFPSFHSTFFNLVEVKVVEFFFVSLWVFSQPLSNISLQENPQLRSTDIEFVCQVSHEMAWPQKTRWITLMIASCGSPFASQLVIHFTSHPNMQHKLKFLAWKNNVVYIGPLNRDKQDKTNIKKNDQKTHQTVAHDFKT